MVRKRKVVLTYRHLQSRDGKYDIPGESTGAFYSLQFSGNFLIINGSDNGKTEKGRPWRVLNMMEWEIEFQNPF